MKASKIIVIAAAAAAIGAAIPVSTLLIGSKELPEMPSAKYVPVAAVTTTAALPKELRVDCIRTLEILNSTDVSPDGRAILRMARNLSFIILKRFK